jgi:bifunctional DNA-binding transcriptional regulator/antitoxin component of YhaV-PrlF toxin-antitoxin module
MDMKRSMGYCNAMRTTVTTKNMVTIPAELSRRCSITPGCQLDWEQAKGSESEILVRVIPRRGDLARRLRGAGARWAPGRDSVADLVAERAAEG